MSHSVVSSPRIIGIDFHVKPRCAVADAKWFAEVGLAPVLPVPVAYESFHVVEPDPSLPGME